MLAHQTAPFLSSDQWIIHSSDIGSKSVVMWICGKSGPRHSLLKNFQKWPMMEIEVMAHVLLEVYDEPCFADVPVMVVYHHDTRSYSLGDARPTGKHAQTPRFQPDAV